MKDIRVSFGSFKSLFGREEKINLLIGERQNMSKVESHQKKICMKLTSN
jgi:hypothetical protein